MAACPQCGKQTVPGAPLCPWCGAEMSSTVIERSQPIDERMAEIEGRVETHREVINQNSKVIDQLTEDHERIGEIERLINSSNVYHFNFWPRAWAIFGHQMAVGAIIYVGLILFGIFVATAGRG